MVTEVEPAPFAYPDEPHSRRHGPVYTSYKTYKDWLRDEYVFRCVFCLRREVWLDGHNSFSVEHLKPYDLAPELDCVYTNLVYSCIRCNSFKQTKWPILNPDRNAYASHFRVRDDGTIEGLTRDGKRMIRFLRLDHPKLNEFRRQRIFKIQALSSKRDDAELALILRDELRYPTDLPDLDSMTPVRNTRPDGVHQCFFERRRRGELEETY